MIIAKHKSYGGTVAVYYCNSNYLIKKFNGKVPLMYCGFYLEVGE